MIYFFHHGFFSGCSLWMDWTEQSPLIVPQHPAVSQVEFSPELKAGRHPQPSVSGSLAVLSGSTYGGGKEKDFGGGGLGGAGQLGTVCWVSSHSLPARSTGLKQMQQRNCKPETSAISWEVQSPTTASVLVPKGSVKGGLKQHHNTQKRNCNKKVIISCHTLEQHHYYTFTGQQDE